MLLITASPIFSPDPLAFTASQVVAKFFVRENVIARDGEGIGEHANSFRAGG